MRPIRTRGIAAWIWWALLPYEGWFSYRIPGDPRPPLHAYPLMWIWRLNERIFRPAPFEPMPPVVCNCDFCRGVPGAVFEP